MTARTRGPRILALERRPVATVKPARRQSRRAQRARRTLTLQVRGASLGPLAMVILVLSPRLTEGPRAAFRPLTQGLGEHRFVRPGGPPPGVADCGAIVVDGPETAQPPGLPRPIRA